MKKLVSSLLAAALCSTTFAMCLCTDTDAALYKKGDANNDGSLDLKDSCAIKAAILGADREYDPVAADVDSNGVCNTRDSFYLKRALLFGTEIEDGFGWEGFFIGGVPVSEYDIIVTDPDNDNMCFAAEELQKYIKEGDGSETEIFKEDTDSPYKVVFTSVGDGSMGDDGFNLKVENGTLTVTAAPLRGSMYAVYAILEEYWGYRFYGYNDWELLRDGKSDVPDKTDDTQIPEVINRCNCMTPYKDQYTYQSVIKRRLSGCTDQGSMLQSKYGWGRQREFANAHSFDVFIPFDEITDNVRCLTYQGGEDDPDFVGTFEVCLKNMKALIESRLAAGAVIGKNLTEISCSYSSEEKFCQCMECYQVRMEEGSYAGVLVRFVNMIDNELKKDYPGLTVVTNAYGEVRTPPKMTALNDDIVLLYCWNGCSNHYIGNDSCSEEARINGMGSNKVEKSNIEGWASKCKHIYIWYYPTNIYYLLCPQPNFFKLRENFSWFSDLGVEGYYIQGTSGSSFEDLDAYLISNLMWDPQMSEEEYIGHIKEYLKYSYGYGWTYIYEYMQMLDECGSLMDCVLNDFDHPFAIYSKEYFAKNFGKMRSLFEKAEAEALSDRERNNIERLSAHMKFLGYSATYERDFVNGAAKEEWAAGWEETYNYINDNSIPVTYDRNRIRNSFTTSKSPMELAYGFDD